tara:strand:- start:13517 stop:15046 length:1530 start_codon:yes stop_codon:yes gene_type:complete
MRQVREGHGCESQEQRCKQYAKMQMYDIIETFRDEGVSGGLIDRPGMQELLCFLDKKTRNEPIVVIFDDIKRLARDIEGHFALKTSICTRNATIESPSMRFDDTPEGKFVETVLAGAGELERNQNKKQVRNRMQARLESGYWVFDYPPGYKYEKVAAHGKLLVADEPKAAIIKEALEGYASGRFQSQLDVQLFLQKQNFTHRSEPGVVHHEQVRRILTQVLYTGYIEYTPWEVTRRKGHHRGLVSLETYERIQERIAESEYRKYQKDISDDFPLRGFVECATCRKPLTAGWTKGRSSKHPYYRCQTKGCAMRSKSIRKADIEKRFTELLATLKPRPNVMRVVQHEFTVLWEQRIINIDQIHKDREQKIAEVELEIKQCIEKIKLSSSTTVLHALEREIEELESKKLRYGESIQEDEMRDYDFDDALNRVFGFLSDPLKRWKEGDLRQKQLVLRMVFDKSLVYDREEGYCTTEKELKITHPMQICCIQELDEMEVKRLVEMPGIEPGSNM